MRSSLRPALLVLVLALVARFPVPAAAAGPSFTMTVKSAFLRSQPSFAAQAVASAFAGQSYLLVGRTDDSSWLQLNVPGAAGPAWVFVGYGLVAGDLGSVPVTGTVTVDVAPATAPLAAAPASGPVQITIRVRSAFARSAPSLSSARVLSVFNGELYHVLAKSADGLWLRLDVRSTPEAWVLANYGTALGDLSQLPVGAGAPATSSPPPAALPGTVLPTVSARARAIYQAGLALGNNPRAFSKIGDCMSTPPFFLAPFDKGEYRLGLYASLQDAITNFAGSFGRESLSAHDGLNVKSVFDPIWANPRQCQRGEGPLACEYRLNRPSLAIVSLGTNGTWQSREEYETYLRQVIDYSIQSGVLPILSTKADNLEGDDRFNQVMNKLAAEYELPLWDFAAEVRVLPNAGLVDAYHLSWGQANFDQAGPLRLGWQVRNLTALQSLDAVWRAVR